MNITEIQKRVDHLAAAMVAKGMREPHAEAQIRAHAESQILLRWMAGLDRGMLGDAKYEFTRGDLAGALDKADAFVASQPSPEQAKQTDFMAALGATIALGNKYNIEVEFLNPLTATMKRLSENVITDQRPVEAAE